MNIIIYDEENKTYICSNLKYYSNQRPTYKSINKNYYDWHFDSFFGTKMNENS